MNTQIRHDLVTCSIDDFRTSRRGIGERTRVESESKVCSTRDHGQADTVRLISNV